MSLVSSVPSLTSTVTIFLGILIEALPFLLAGTVASGIVEVFVSKEKLEQIIPKHRILAPLGAALMGLVIPVCECGVVPFVRRLIAKGLPPSAAIAFLFAAPILNPIVIISTTAAYGIGKVVFIRIGCALFIALTGGLFAERFLNKEICSKSEHLCCSHCHHDLLENESLFAKIMRVLNIARSEFFEIGLLLIIGSALAACFQTLISQKQLLSLGGNSVISVLVLMALAYILSVCSTIDAFISLGFAKIFPFGAVMAFLVFGPMVDIKSTLIFFGAFKKRAAFFLILYPLITSLIIGVLLNVAGLQL